MHQHPARDEDGVDVRAISEAGQPVHGRSRRPQVRLSPIDHDDVRALAGFQRPDLVTETERAGAAEGRHLQELPGRQDAIILKMARVVAMCLEHDAEHVERAVGRRRVAAERDGDALLHQFQRGTAAEHGHERGRVVGDGSARAFQGLAVVGLQVDAMGEKRRRPAEPDARLGRRERAVAVPVLDEERSGLPRQPLGGPRQHRGSLPVVAREFVG